VGKAVEETITSGATTEIPYTERVLSGWGLRCHSRARVRAPRTVEALRAALLEHPIAAGSARTIALRGAGCSYGDVALNGGATVLDTTGLGRILAWDPATGIVTAEPGVTIAQLWRSIVADGWWPAVVPGTSAVTLGGAAALNIHGKNNWHVGAFGEHVKSCEVLLPSGEIVACSREHNAELFDAAIGGMGLFGAFTALTLQTHRIHSGLIAEVQRPYTALDALLAGLEEATVWATDLVAWIDTSATGARLGRGLLKAGRDLLPGEDTAPAASLSVAAQLGPRGLPSRLPAGLIPRLARPMTTRPGVWAANRAQWSRGHGKHARDYHLATYARANFLLDAIPNWRDTYRPGGLLQHQAFVPTEAAPVAFAELLRRSQSAGIVPSLAVLKKHRPSGAVLDYLLDGYSLALDYPVRRGNEARTVALLATLNDVTADYGGRVYFAKDATATPAQVRRMYGDAALERFVSLKARYDPDGALSTDLYRRLFA
jgi:decaprenylphospho-beta-D-ribofuranose 2-oxidase